VLGNCGRARPDTDCPALPASPDSPAPRGTLRAG
jgi:hypothetical protein